MSTNVTRQRGTGPESGEMVRSWMNVSRQGALEACEKARGENRRKYFSADHWQCWGRMRFGGEPEKRCMHANGGWGGCAIVNRMLAGASPQQPST